MMIIMTIVGIGILLLIELIIYKKSNGKLKTFVKSKQMLDIFKEILIILISTTLALNFASIDDNNKTSETVIKLLEVTQNDINSQYMHNTYFVDEYNNGTIDAQMLKANIKNNSALIESILDNDVIMTTVSPLMYSVLINDLRTLKSFYNHLSNAEDEESIVTMALSINSHSENILWALDIEIKHLQKQYSEKELHSLYQEYIDSKYEIIETQ